MASETVASNPFTSSEQVKEEVHEEIKTSVSEIVTSTKESEEVEKPKVEDLLNPAVPLAESEETIDDKPNEPPLIEELKKTDEVEKPKADYEEKILDTPIEASVIEEEKKTDEEEKPKAEAEEKIEDPVSEEVRKTDDEENPNAESEDKPVEVSVIEEVKKTDEGENPKAELEEKIDDENIEPPPLLEEVKESDGEEKPKAEDVPTQVVPSVESEVDIVDKKIELPVLEEIKKTDEEEKPKAEDSPIPAVLLAESEEKIEDKLPLVEEVKHTDERAEISELKVDDKQIEPPVDTDNSIVAEGSTAKPETPDVSEPVADIVQSQSETDTSEKTKEEEPAAESVIEKLAEQPKTEVVPESLIEAVEVEQVEILAVKEVEPALLKVKKLEAESTTEVTEQLAAVVDKTQESVAVVPDESVEAKIAKGEDGPADKVDETKLVKEKESAGEEPPATEDLGEVTITKKEDQVDAKEDTLIEAAEGLSKEAPIELEKIEADSEAKNVKFEESTLPETKEVEEVTSSISITEAAEKAAEGEIISRGLELAAENGKEDVKSETVASVETNNSGAVEEKTLQELSEAEGKVEKNVETDETKSEKEKEAGDTKTPEIPNAEPIKDLADLPKEEVTVKSTQKWNSILSKVKQTLVKAKKAIIGKSPNSKTPSEIKGEVKI